MRVFCLFALLPACIENKLSVPGAGNGDDDQPAIEVWPPVLEFDALPMGESASLSVTVTNAGLGPLDLSGAQISGTSAFTLVDVPTLTLAPDDSVDVTVDFSPINPEDHGSLYLLSDDPVTPSVEVPLTGGAQVGELLVLPDPLDFGAVPLGCSQSGSVYLENIGSVPLTISSIVPLGASFGATWDFALPLTIPAGGNVEVPLTYSPDDLEPDEGQVWITSDAIVGLTIADQRGTGTTASSMEDEWWQGNGPWDQTDIVFYVDQSLSMTDDKARLQANFANFIGILEGLDLDWQIMVVTDEDGCHNESILDRGTPDAEAQFIAAVDGPWGRYTEAGLTLVTEALSQASAGGCNEGFLRPNAKTTAVMVSDEPEQSRKDWMTLVTEMQGYSSNVSITSIVGDEPLGCATAEPGAGYVEASLATGGAVLSICNDDWSSYFQTIASLSALGQTDTFVLTSEPDPATLLVNVDGRRSTDWTYDPTWNAIVFAPSAIPAPGVQIQASYDIAADCAF